MQIRKRKYRREEYQAHRAVVVLWTLFGIQFDLRSSMIAIEWKLDI